MTRSRSLALLVLVFACSLQAAEPASLLKTLRSVGAEGAGNVEAATAWRELVKQGIPALLPTLAAMDGANVSAANWLRTAVDAIAEHALADKKSLPVQELEAFLGQTDHAPQARRLAYELLGRADAKAPARLLPAMLNDSSVELRRDAVAVFLQKAQAQLDGGDKATAKDTYQKLLTSARDRDQVEQIAKSLKGLGVDVDLPTHFGFIRGWQLLAPFDNVKGVGFAKAYPPETSVDLTKSYTGKSDKEIRWVEHVTTDPYGQVDLNKVVGKNMGVVGYAYAVVESPKVQSVQVRAGSNNAIKMFLNGKAIFFREEYHHGDRMDQHVGIGTLKAGRNEVLIKVCQNEQTENWAQKWSFQLRICDAVGGAVPMTLVAK
jgi:hypothetical protein